MAGSGWSWIWHIGPAVQLENLAGGVREMMMQITDESGDLVTGVEATQCVSGEDPCPALFGDGCGHAGGEKSRQNRVDPDVAMTVTGRQINDKT